LRLPGLGWANCPILSQPHNVEEEIERANLVAYYRHEDENIIIITAYKSSRIHRYLKQ